MNQWPEGYTPTPEDLAQVAKSSQTPSTPEVEEGRCEDYPCCDHGEGGCPDRDEKGRKTYKCVQCGASLPHDTTSSICIKCRTNPRRSPYTSWPDERTW